MYRMYFIDLPHYEGVGRTELFIVNERNTLGRGFFSKFVVNANHLLYCGWFEKDIPQTAARQFQESYES